MGLKMTGSECRQAAGASRLQQLARKWREAIPVRVAVMQLAELGVDALARILKSRPPLLQQTGQRPASCGRAETFARSTALSVLVLSGWASLGVLL